MAVAQIVFRNLFDAGIVWGDLLIRILVLWVGLSGAMVASRENRHISIDIITRYLPPRAKIAADAITALFAAAVCSIAAWYSFQFVKTEFEMGGRAFAQVPTWLCEAVIPIAFAVIGLRYLILSAIHLLSLKRSELQTDPRNL
jgi:TRAP-type C4-dicarboxylate transport system permease small subunit